MRSSSNVSPLLRGALDEARISHWLLADLSVPEPGGAAEPKPEIDRAAAARAEAEERAQAEEEARLEAERLEAERQEQRVREAYERGYEEGRREGEIAEGARLRTAVRAAQEALDELRAGEVRWTGTIEENICALAVAVARHVIGRELDGDVRPVLDLVRSALAEFPIDQPIRIRISPGDLQAIRQLQQDGKDPSATMTEGREARWIADSQVVPGGCVVEGRDRIVDGRVDSALERIYRRLTYTHA